MKNKIKNALVIILMFVLVLLFDLCYGEEVSVSYSARSCIIADMPYDYEYRFSYKYEDEFSMNLLMEREKAIRLCEMMKERINGKQFYLLRQH